MAKRNNMVNHVQTINQENQEDHNSKQKPQHSNCLKIKIDNLKTLTPLTENQKKFFDAYKRGDYFIGLLGTAGTGKTICAMYKALEEVLDKGNPFSKLIIVRSAVPTRDLGHLPGSVDEKMEIYELPFVQICSSLFNRADAYQRLKEQHVITFIPTSYIRGMTFDNAVVIFEEIQSNTYHEISSLMQRIGHQSKLILCGDLKQNDLLYKKNDTSGLGKFLEIARLMDEFTEISFTVDDIVRSSLVKSWIMAEEQYEELSTN